MTPKPVRAYALVSPEGNISIYSVSKTKGMCIARSAGDGINRTHETWQKMKAQGYRCIPVLISAIKKGEGK